MRRLPDKLYTNKQPSTTCKNMCTRENSYRFPIKPVEALQTAYERKCYDKSRYLVSSIRWFELTSKELKKHIHHALWVHGGDRWIAGAPVHSYDPKRDVISVPRVPFSWMQKAFSEWETKNHKQRKARDEASFETAEHTRKLRELGYRVIEKATQNANKNLPTRHLLGIWIVPRQNAEKRGHSVTRIWKCASTDFSQHWRHPWIWGQVYLRCKPPKRWFKSICKSRRGVEKNIRVTVGAESMPEDIDLFRGKRHRAFVEWCDQVPVLGYNCGYYDLNLIKEHFAVP